MKTIPLLVLVASLSWSFSVFSKPTKSKRAVAQDSFSNSLKSTHEALFGMLFPAEQIAHDPELLKILEGVREDLWKKVSVRSETRWGFRILDFMSILKGGFAGRSLQEQRTLFRKLETSPINSIRKGARFLRAYYLYSIYASDVGKKISGMPRPPIAREDLQEFLKSNFPKFPISSFRYNPAKSELASTQGPIDVVVVGSGPAGAVLAHEFVKKGQRVILLEQGSFAVPEAVDTRRILNFHENFGMRLSTDGGVIFRNGNTVGGGSTINVDLAFSPQLPFIQSRVEEWRQQGLIPTTQWTGQEMETAYSWVKEHVGTRSVPEAEINANNKVLWNGAIKQGRKPSLYDLNTYAPGKSPSPVVNKKSAVSAFLLPAMLNQSHPLTMVPGAKALRILWSDKPAKDGDRTAVGIEFEKVPQWNEPGSIPDPHQLGITDGSKVKVYAKHIFIAAGSLGSPAILLRSGTNNPNIGRAPVAHPSIPLIGLFDHEIKIWEGTPSSVYVADHALTNGTILEAMTADVSYAAMMLPGDSHQVFDLVKNVKHMGGFGVLLIDTPDSKNRIKLDKSGNAEIEYRLPEQDVPRFAKALADAAKIMLKAGAKKVFIPSNETSFSEITTSGHAEAVASQIRFISNRTTLTSAHLQASCKMGSDPKKSVVNARHRVWKTQNVYVVDGSVFPSSIGANPMQSIYVIAKIFADRWDQ